MKTSKKMTSTLAAFLIFHLGSVQAFGEAVKTTSTKSSAKSSSFSLTDEEKANGATTSPYQACKGVLIVESSNYGKDFWQKRKTSCDAKVSNCNMPVQVIPDTGMFKSFKGVNTGPNANMSSQVTAVAFLESIRQKAEVRLGNGISEREKQVANCYGPKATGTDVCRATKAALLGSLKKELPDFRLAVAQMYEPTQAELMNVILRGDVSSIINDGLSKAKVHELIPKMEKLSSAEFVKVKKTYEDLLARAKTEWAKEVKETVAKRGLKGREAVEAEARLNTEQNLAAKFRNLLADNRAAQLTNYLRAIDRVPEIAYLGNSEAANPEIAAAVSMLVSNAKDSLASMKKVKSKDLNSEKMDNSLLQFASYSRLIEEVLEEEVKKGAVSSCAVATAVHNELQAVKGQDAVVALGATLLLGGIGVGGALRAAKLGAEGAKAAAGWSNFAITSGIVGGAYMTGMDVVDAAAMNRDAKAGLVKAEDARAAAETAALGTVFAPLDWIGSGAVIGAGVALAGKTVGKFAAASIAKGKLSSKAATAADLRKLATTAASSEGKDVQTVNRLGMAVDGAAKDLLGRAPTATDEKAISQMAKSGLLGTADAPATEAAKDYAAATLKMTADEREAYVARLDEITGAAKPAEVKGRAPAVDPARSEEAGRLAVAIASEPELKATAAILKPDSGWSKDAIKNLREVVQSARRLAKGTSETVSARFKKALANMTGESPNSARVNKLCACAGACPVGASLDGGFDGGEPVYVACVNPTHLPSLGALSGN